MRNELVFRLTALAIAVTYMTMRSVFERKLGTGSKWTALKNMDRDSRLELVVVSYGTMPQWVYMLSPWIDFAALGLPLWLRLAGAGIAASGAGLFIWTHGQLAGNWSPAVERARAGALITSGPYRWVRHPMYTSFFLYNVGLLLLVSNWFAGVPPVLAFAWMYWHRVGREERVMLEQFGEAYVEYAHTTGRIVPGVGAGKLG